MVASREQKSTQSRLVALIGFVDASITAHTVGQLRDTRLSYEGIDVEELKVVAGEGHE